MGRLVRYRGKAHLCNRCPVKDSCTDSYDGREIVRPLDPWPHSEVGRFHRGLALALVALAELILLIELARHHGAVELLVLLPTVALATFAGLRLAEVFLTTPSGFPEAPTPQPAVEDDRWATLWSSWERADRR